MFFYLFSIQLHKNESGRVWYVNYGLNLVLSHYFSVWILNIVRIHDLTYFSRSQRSKFIWVCLLQGTFCNRWGYLAETLYICTSDLTEQISFQSDSWLVQETENIKSAITLLLMTWMNGSSPKKRNLVQFGPHHFVFFNSQASTQFQIFRHPIRVLVLRFKAPSRKYNGLQYCTFYWTIFPLPLFRYW
jgi:hypothetical protein